MKINKDIMLSENEYKNIKKLYKNEYKKIKKISDAKDINSKIRSILKKEFPQYWNSGTLCEMLLNRALKEKDDELIEIVLEQFYIEIEILYQLLFEEDWHYSHEEIVNTIIACGKKDMLSILTDIALFDPDHWDSYAIHNKAIREIFSIAGKDALDTLLSLRDNVDEEALPTLEKMIKRCEALQYSTPDP